MGTMGAAGVGAFAGASLGTLATSSVYRPVGTYRRPYYTNNYRRRYQPPIEIPPPCPPGKTVGPYDTVCSLPDCPAGQAILPNGQPCKLPYCPFNQTIGFNNTPCQLPPCLPGFKIGPWGSLCALPACPPGKTSGPFGALCST